MLFHAEPKGVCVYNATEYRVRYCIYVLCVIYTCKVAASSLYMGLIQVLCFVVHSQVQSSPKAYVSIATVPNNRIQAPCWTS